MKVKKQPPQTNEQWIQEIRAAWKDAREVIPYGHMIGHNMTDHELFHIAPDECLKFRGIKPGKKARKKASDAALTSYVANRDNEPILQDPHMAFAFCYILSHYGLGLIDITEGEELLGFIEDNLERIKASQTLVSF